MWKCFQPRKRPLYSRGLLHDNEISNFTKVRLQLYWPAQFSITLHCIAASRRGQAGFSAAKSAPQFKFIIGLLQDLEMLGVGRHQTRDTGPLQVSHSTSNRIKEQELKRSFWSKSNNKRISVHNSLSMLTMCWSGIVSCFLVRALAHVTTSHPCQTRPRG